MGIPLLQGRFFTLSDTIESAHVIVIDANMARRSFAGRDAVGQTISFVHVGAYKVIGVVGHVRHWGLDDTGKHSPYQVYSALYQISDEWMPVMYPDVTVTVRTPLEPATAVPAIKQKLHGAELYDPHTMQQLASGSIVQFFPMILMGTFAALALLRASIGIYGVISYSVEYRVQEIGIRMALGADRSDVLRSVMGEGFRLALAGIGIGATVALALARILSSFSNLLYGVGARDPETFAAGSLALIGIALLACYIPARRAVRIDPISALRQE